MARNTNRLRAGWFFFLAALITAPAAHADLAVTINPSSPTSDQDFDLRAFHWFGDTGQQRLEQSISISGNQIDVFVSMQNLHTNPDLAFPQVITPDGALLRDIGPLAAGTYHVNAEMWLTHWPAVSGGTLFDTGSLTFEVTGPPNSSRAAGDLNGDGVTDAADYIVWRTGGVSYTANDYQAWRTHFGEQTGGGGGAAGIGPLQTATPEPAAMLLVIAAVGRLFLRPRITP